MANTFVTTGVMTDGQTVRLDEPLPVASGQVRVTVEVIPPRQPFLQTLQEIWEGQRKRGHVPRSAEEIAADIRAERESWGD